LGGRKASADHDDGDGDGDGDDGDDVNTKSRRARRTIYEQAFVKGVAGTNAG
jgi:hypothetical protein